MSAERVLLLRDWPGKSRWSWNPPPDDAARLWQRNALILHVAAARGAVPETFGMGAALVVSGPSIVAGCLIVPDGMAEIQPNLLRRIRSWAKRHPLSGSVGPWPVVTLSSFFDPFATVECQPWAFQPNAYSGAGFVVGADLGRSFGLCAEHVAARRGKAAGTWELWLPGWGTQDERGCWHRVTPHRPPLRLAARRSGWQVEFGPCPKGAGKIHKGRLWRGAFADMLSAAYALDADRAASFAEHREDFGLEPVELPISVDLDTDGAARLTGAVRAIHELALVLDDEAGRWFTTAQDRRERRGRVDLVRTVSPAGLAAQIPARFGLRPPLETFDLTDDEHRRWAEAYHGGWCEAERRLLGVPIPVRGTDVSSCYPLVAHHLGWWDVLCAKRLRRSEVTAELHRVVERALADPTSVLDPALWRRLGATLVEVVPDGEQFPVAFDDVHRPDGRLEIVPLSSPRRPICFAWPDVVLAAVRSGRAPTILAATRYVPVGRQEMRRRLPVVPGLALRADVDPVLALVQRRRRAKARGDLRLAAVLRVVANSLVFGNPSRFDPVRQRTGERWVLRERPGAWTCLPIASSVAAGARLLLALLDRKLSDLGGVTAYRDTDSALIVATPDGDSVGLGDGSSAAALAWAEIDEVLRSFDRLDPDPTWPVWQAETRALTAVVFGPKRHGEFAGTSGSPDIKDATETGLGGTYADPPSLPGRMASVDGFRRWSMAAVARELAYAGSQATNGPEARRPAAPWDAGPREPFPALRRLAVKTPEIAAALPAVLGARPGTRYVEAEVDDHWGSSVGSPVALDPGGDLADWAALGWVDRRTGKPVEVTTEPGADATRVRLVTLDDRGVAWAAPPRSEPVEAIEVDPALVRRVGRVSGVFDAYDDGEPGELLSFRPDYGDDQLASVQREAERLGPAVFAAVVGVPEGVAERAAEGKRIGARHLRRALRAMESTTSGPASCPVDGLPVRTVGARYCSPRCKETAKKRRQRARATATRKDQE